MTRPLLLGALGGLASAALLACSSDPRVAADAPDAGGTPAVVPPADASVDAPVTPPSSGFSAPFGEWTWLDVPGSKCAQGSETGIGYKRGTGDKVFIFMQGGSLCVDADCKLSPYYTKWTGYGSKEFYEALAQASGEYEGQSGIDVSLGFRDLNAVSPTFADASLVYIPYCSGDYFIGSADKDWGTWKAQYRGKSNVNLFLQAIAAGFPNATRFIISGGSAGSVGAMQNYHRAVSAFGGRRVDLVTDSYSMIGENIPQFVYPVTGPVLPPDCSACATDYRAIYDYDSSLAQKLGGRIAVLDSEGDWTLDWALFFQQQTDYTKGLKNLQGLLDGLPNTRYYIADGSNHVLLKSPLMSSDTDIKQHVKGSLATDTHYVSEFLTRMQNDDPGWMSLSSLRDDALTCKTECNGRTCGADSCGGVCGTCPSGWSCDGDYGHCTKNGAFDVGETTALETSTPASDLFASKITLGSHASLLKSLALDVDLPLASEKLRLGIYDSTGPNGNPGKLLATTDSFDNTAGWNKKPLTTFVSLPAGDYWIAFLASSSSVKVKQTTTSGNFIKSAKSWGELPATFPNAIPSTGHFSAYATVTP